MKNGINNREVNLKNENLNNKLNLRDYDKEPLIIKNNFITYLNDLSAMLLVNLMMVFCIFYSGAIDWSSGEYSEIFIRELRNPRLSTAILIIFVLNIVTIISIIKKIINPRKVFFYGDRIFFNHKNITMQKSYITDILKSMYPVLGKNVSGFFGKFGFILAVLFIYLIHFFVILIKLLVSLFNKDFKFTLFCTIVFYDNQKNAINVYLMTKKDYKQVNEYLSQNFNLQIENLDKNYKFSK